MDTYYEIDKPPKHYAYWKKTDTSDQILYYFIYKNYPEKAKLQRQKID